jgi:hypothetical protein
VDEGSHGGSCHGGRDGIPGWSKSDDDFFVDAAEVFDPLIVFVLGGWILYSIMG